MKTFTAPRRIASPFEGNLQLLPDGGALVGWGGVRIVSEFARDGRLRFQMGSPTATATAPTEASGPGALSRRRSRLSVTAPSTQAGTARPGLRVEALAGPDKAHLQPIGSADWAGLETAIPAGAFTAGVVAVRALDLRGRVLGTSRVTGG